MLRGLKKMDGGGLLQYSLVHQPVGKVRVLGRGRYGWRFQATDVAGESDIFDVYRSAPDWHLHHAYR